MKFAYNEDERTMVWSFDDGRTVSLAVDKIQEKDATFLNGAKQKMVDVAAGAKKLSLDGTKTVEEWRHDLMKEMRDRLIDGTAFVRQAREGSSKVSLLILAVADLYDIDEAEASAKLKDKTADELKALQANPKIAAKMAEIKAKQAAERAARLAEDLGDEDDEEMPEL